MSRMRSMRPIDCCRFIHIVVVVVLVLFPLLHQQHYHQHDYYRYRYRHHHHCYRHRHRWQYENVVHWFNLDLEHNNREKPLTTVALQPEEDILSDNIYHNNRWFDDHYADHYGKQWAKIRWADISFLLTMLSLAMNWSTTTSTHVALLLTLPVKT